MSSPAISAFPDGSVAVLSSAQKKHEMEKKQCDYFCCYLGSEKTKKEKTANNPRRLQGKNTRTFLFFYHTALRQRIKVI